MYILENCLKWSIIHKDNSSLHLIHCLITTAPNGTSFVEEIYRVSEDIGVENFALRVCINTFALESDTVISLISVSGTAQGN